MHSPSFDFRINDRINHSLFSLPSPLSPRPAPTYNTDRAPQTKTSHDNGAPQKCKP